MNEKVWIELYASIGRGKNEEIGSADVFEVDGSYWYVNKTGEHGFSLYADGEMVPVCVVEI